MNVLVVTNDFPPRVGGINYYVGHIARRFPPGEVTVFASAWEGARAFDADHPARVVRWPARTMLPTPAVLDRVAGLARETRADVVLFGAAFPLALLGPAIRRRTGVPYAAFTHGWEVGAASVPGGALPLRRIASGAALLTAVSGWTRDVISRAVGPGVRIELLPPGIDRERFHPGVDDRPVRERHGLGDRPVVCCVSRLVPRKGQDQVIRALPRIAQEFPDVAFLVVGAGPYGHRLRSLAAERGVAGRVVFAGEVPYEELPAYFRAGEVFAMPARTMRWGIEVEAYGAVYTQANAVGRPSVGGRSGGAPEAVRDGETGLVVDGTSVEDVAEGVLTLLRDPELAAKMGRAGAEWVHAELTWEAIATRLRELLRGVLER